MFICDSCDHFVEAWSDGNPYFFDRNGRKQYAYHPNHDLLALCIGNDKDHLCLTCSHEFRIDSRDPQTTCPKCKSEQFSDSYELDGKPCPWCHAGVLKIDPEFHAIS